MLSEETLADITSFSSSLLEQVGILLESECNRAVKQKNAVLEKLEDLITQKEYNEFIENYSPNPAFNYEFFRNEELRKAEEIFQKVSEESGISLERNKNFFTLVFKRIVETNDREQIKTHLKNILTPWNGFLSQVLSETNQKSGKLQEQIKSLENQLKQLQAKDYENRIIKLTPQLFINQNPY